jgi:hypothetical protein
MVRGPTGGLTSPLALVGGGPKKKKKHFFKCAEKFYN